MLISGFCSPVSVVLKNLSNEFEFLFWLLKVVVVAVVAVSVSIADVAALGN